MLALAVSGALLVVAFAAAPSANASTLYACVKKKSGAVRLVSKSTKCKKSEKKVSWNTEGPAGLRGPQGLDGKAGGEGKGGAEGKSGLAGAAGTARAYAFMETPGVTACKLLSGETKNFTACSRPTTGIYCLTPAAGIDPTVFPAFVTVEWGRSSGSTLAAFVEDANLFGATDDCGTTRYEVRTYNFSSTPSDAVAFYILVP
jgi:hypothetical protein